MKHATLIAAAVLVLVANAFALLHAARNRSGAPDAEIVLTDRELRYYHDSNDSGVSLRLKWVDMFRYSSLNPDGDWLDRAKLIELGFDCSVPPGDKDAYTFYRRQSSRSAFVALEYDGAAWRSWARDEERRDGSRLVIIDAALDPSILRARHPARDRILIAPAVIRIYVVGPTLPGTQSYLSGSVQEIPSVIHVPRPFSDRFREPGRTLYRVRLRYGALLEPWVTAVEFLK